MLPLTTQSRGEVVFQYLSKFLEETGQQVPKLVSLTTGGPPCNDRKSKELAAKLKGFQDIFLFGSSTLTVPAAGDWTATAEDKLSVSQTAIKLETTDLQDL
ncbi:hypothetical protein CHS0354_021893 [Potamilus streckersoni]|uniref:Uncharacterized protein n=1 Tax=Potamilus streckersoni TaxID=2493646 RepID=A0AAE0TKH6_9BIVA|nr:hypothetical protein CHS0354_021893 [Potamilus streckersoni]